MNQKWDKASIPAAELFQAEWPNIKALTHLFVTPIAE